MSIPGRPYRVQRQTPAADSSEGSRGADVDGSAAASPTGAVGEADPIVQLEQRAASGSPASLGELLRRLEPRLHHAVFRIIGRTQDTADVLQDAFVKVVERFQTYEGRARLSTWITRIVINQSFDHLRHHRRQQEHQARFAASASPQAPAGPLEQLSLKDSHERAAATLLRMPPEFRAVLVLRDVAEFSYEEIAVILQLPAGTVKSRLFRARLMLRERLRAGAQDGAGPDAGAQPLQPVLHHHGQPTAGGAS